MSGTTRTCASCERPLGNLASRCMHCGMLVAGAVVVTARKPVLVECPGCDRKVRVLPDEPSRCMYCAIQLIANADPNRPARLAPASDAPRAARADIESILAGLPAKDPWDLVRDVVSARAETHDLLAGETEAIVDDLRAVTRWQHDGRDMFLPLGPAKAEALVPRAIFGVADYGVFRDRGETELLIPLAARPRARSTTREDAINALGLASSLAFGVGFGAKKVDAVDTRQRFQIRVVLHVVEDGVELEPHNQIDQEPPTPLLQQQRDALVGRIANSRRILEGYYVLAALFGTSCRGSTAFSITREAIAKRMTALTCSRSPAIVDALTIRMPPAFDSV
jgi:hypothetical protein